jgi:hypothetical protein
MTRHAAGVHAAAQCALWEGDIVDVVNAAGAVAGPPPLLRLYRRPHQRLHPGKIQ